MLAALELVSVHLEDGDPHSARRSFELAHELVAEDHIGAGLVDCFARARTVLAIATGDLVDARVTAESITDQFWNPISRARVFVALGDRASANEMLALAEPRCVRHDVILNLMRARTVDDDDASSKHLVTAVHLATEYSLLQTVASECADSMEIIERVALYVPKEWMDRLRRAAAHHAREIVGDDRHVEPLTERERDVLRLLPSRLSMREIANELYVSVNTLKFHLRVIYRKLGVNSREEAAAVARSMSTVRGSSRSAD